LRLALRHCIISFPLGLIATNHATDRNLWFQLGYLWNIGETGMQDIHDAKRDVSLAGKHMYNIIVTGKGETSTYLAGINTAGKPIPPVITRGKTVGEELVAE